MIQIRSATAGDAEALAGLRWEFRALRGDAPVEERHAFVARCAEWMRAELGADRPWRAWIAERDGSPVGQVWLQTIQKIPNPIGEKERHAYVSNLYVTPAARGTVGTQLLDAALAEASASGVDRVVLWPSPRSRTLYLRRGFTPNGDVLELVCP